MSRQLTARATAAKTLAAVQQGDSLARALPAHLETSVPDHRALIQELVYGTLREWPRLDGIARQLLRKPLREKDADIHGLILMGIQELSALQTPPHAAVDETVKAARSLGKSWSSGLVNACLRNYQRESERLELALTAAQQHALPEWLWDKLGQQWPEHRDEIAEASRKHPPLTLRANQSRVDASTYCQSLQQAGINAYTNRDIDTAITLEQPQAVATIPGFPEGLSSVQDASAQLAAHFLQPRNQERILDACAAPGGKTCHILEAAPQAKVLATDISERRLISLRQNIERLGLSPDIKVIDASRAAEQLEGQTFDAVLADVPCSAAGVIRRNPDIKITRSANDIDQFAQQQAAIVLSLWPLVRPGGRLLYVTCSILEEENDQLIETLCPRLQGCQVAALTSSAGMTTRLGFQTLPDSKGGDGLYFSLLIKETGRE